MKSTDPCAKQDWDWKTLGSEITCPKGVRYCRIRQTGLESFRRGCDSNLFDDLDDNDAGFGLGGCSSSTCFCAGNKCNTGFHGEDFYTSPTIQIKNESISLRS